MPESMISRPRASAAPARTRWWQALLLIVMALIVVSVSLEIAARTLSWRLDKGFWSRPHSSESAFFVTYDWPPPLISGHLGTFRTGQTVPMAKPAGELRVVCLGGSTTVNARNADRLTYSRELQETLATRFPEHRVWVLNAGGDAFSTAHSLTNLSLRVLAFEPDVITVLHNINDATAVEYGDELLPDYSNKYLDDSFLAYEHRRGFGGAILRMSRGAQILKWRLDLLSDLLERSSHGSGVDNPEAGLEAFGRNLRSIVAVARAANVRPVLITQAHRDGESQGVGGRFAVYNDSVRAVAADTGSALAEVGRPLSGRSEFFLDAVHLTSEGVRALASVLEPVVAAELEAGLASIEAGPP